MASLGHLRRCSDVDTSNKCLSREKRCFYAIMANFNGSLEAVDCRIHSVRYDMVQENRRQATQIGPHQVTYDVVEFLIRRTNA
eukprot:scaffold15_cov85-Skeletonema_dohrnii-CCMP3373.AAC.3